ncbi:A/G-specific adenine glycosylase [Elioraea rosea]|uniref:A/G-specific adenine glycosylase n=1 Tax=Elioraea rosea TaxID=2492390 RepID=UPI00194FA74B|nr:A/G-specific adenine glycosylase [Elioraea rosea]
MDGAALDGGAVDGAALDGAAAALLGWYDRHRRVLPWRALPGERADPYRVWLSEVMLQQTTVAAVGPRFISFLARFPNVEALAAAPWEEVAKEWAGLGYYARARNLHAAAKAVAERGGFPRDEAGLRALPGIGGYTAAAVAAIAFGEAAVPVDGNVERVTARLFAVREPLPGAKRRLAELARSLGAQEPARARPGDFAQALFDLGATVCTPRRPACALCPLVSACAARREGIAETLPAKAEKRAKPQRYGIVFWLEDRAGHVLLRRRPPEGLLGGMLELPGTPWRGAAWEGPDALAHAPGNAEWREAGLVRHVFTHFALDLAVLAGRVDALPGEGVPREAVLGAGLPAVMAKAARLALADHSIGRSLARSTSRGSSRPRSS